MARIDPQRFEQVVRNGNILDWQVMPLHAGRFHRFAQTRDPQMRELMVLHQRYDGSRAPFSDRPDIEIEIAVPIAGASVEYLFSRAQRHSDSPAAGRLDAVDPQGRVVRIKHWSFLQMVTSSQKIAALSDNRCHAFRMPGDFPLLAERGVPR
jgi:hypothetical protein